MPLVRPRAAPKLLPLDTATALTAMGFDRSELQSRPFDTMLGGRVAEMLVGQELLAGRGDRELHFWVSESSRANAEVDYLLAEANQLVPVEVKAGAAGSLKSLHQFLWRSGSSRGVRLHSGNLGVESLAVRMPDGPLRYRLESLPLYMAALVS